MLLCGALALTACPAPMPIPDAGEVDAGHTDAGITDAGITDAGITDAGITDAGITDAGPVDAGWSSLFNGTDLTGWDSWLGSAPGAPPAQGLNVDLTGVF
jgi:hypothetical protein